jgi:F0F1-type ATP synthase membrane subunit a
MVIKVIKLKDNLKVQIMRRILTHVFENLILLHLKPLFVPSGCPLALLPLLVLIEFISYLSRNVSLGLRLLYVNPLKILKSM